jgi:hypothetical protein
MIPKGQLTSVLVPYQLPEFIRDNPDYSNFVLFIQAYYEWLEETDNVTDRTKNLLNYKDVDATTSEFINYFYNDFLQYFPKDILANKNEVLKLAKQMYQAKGTPAAFQFLFRTLYNTDVDFFYTKDVVLKASAGKWYVAKSLRLSTNDTNFLATVNPPLRIFGETTKSIATIENVVQSQNKMEVFISNIERLFQSGEFVRIVDSNNQNVYFLNGQRVSANTVGAEVPRAKIVGQISQIKIGTRGNKYHGIDTTTGYPGDPVIVYNGLNANTGHGALATVGTTTKGSIANVSISYGGFGYTDANTQNNHFTNIGFSPNYGVIASVSGLNTSPIVYSGSSYFNPISSITNIPTDQIALYYNNVIGVTADTTTYAWDGSNNWNFSANAHATVNGTLANTFTFTSFAGYPISAVTISNQGGGIETTPAIVANSLYKTTDGNAINNLGDLGILGPIVINNPGKGYAVNDKINFIGGSGYGAYANVTSVNSSGSIINVSYVYSTTSNFPLPLGGLGYRLNALPTVNVANALVTGANVANLSIAGILGQGATFSATPDRVGSITTININDYGQDYIATPNVSFVVQDIVVKNVDLTNFPSRGDIVYQGGSLSTSSYYATVDSLLPIISYANPNNSLYYLRVYNYSAAPSLSLPLHANNKTYALTITNEWASVINSQYPTNGVGLFSTGSPPMYQNGVITYGDGTAKGIATFLNGLTIGQGQYLDTSGQPSSFDVLQSVDYNNYTYQITLEKEIAKYRGALLNLLHPTGMKVRGRFAMKSSNTFTAHMTGALQSGHTLSYNTGTNDSNVVISSAGDFTQLSSNVMTVNYAYHNIATYIFANSSIRFTNLNGEQVFSEVNSVDPVANTVTLKNNVWLTFANVANGTGTAGGNTINISNVYTSSFNIFNNGVYNYPKTPLEDMIHAGDYVKVNNMVQSVKSVDYSNNIITVNGNYTYSPNGNVSLNRVMVASGVSVQIFGPLGTQYEAQLSDENGNIITTEDGNIILIN